MGGRGLGGRRESFPVQTFPDHPNPVYAQTQEFLGAATSSLQQVLAGTGGTHVDGSVRERRAVEQWHLVRGRAGGNRRERLWRSARRGTDHSRGRDGAGGEIRSPTA